MSAVIQPANIAQPARCKLCNGIIGHFAVTWPEPPGQAGGFNQQEFKRLFTAITQHMQTRAAAETAPHNKHQGALIHAAALGGNVTQVFLARHFLLPEAANGYLEQCRGSVHHMTSKFTLTEEYRKQIREFTAAAIFDVMGLGPLSDTTIQAVQKVIDNTLIALQARYEEGHPSPDPKAN